MKPTTVLLTAILSTALYGCGSADSDSDVENLNIGAALGGNSANVTPPVVTTTPSVQTADLQASVQFDFATSWDMDINFALPLDKTYLSLCTDYKLMDNGAVDVKFDSCVIRAPINNGQYVSDDLPMTNAVDSLIAVLIDYANPSSPMYVEFSVAPGKESLDWSEGVTL
jgi:hypothetical protein